MAGSVHQPLRLVLDTNIVVAGLLSYSSPVLLDELARTLGYSKFAARIESFGTSSAALVAQYTALGFAGDPGQRAACGGHRCR